MVIMGSYDDVPVAWDALAAGKHADNVASVKAVADVESLCP